MKLGFASPEHVEIGKRAQPENTQKLTPYTMKEGFASPEHVDIVNGAQPEKLEDRQLILPNGIKIKFEHIVALGGDFYGIPKAPSSIHLTKKTLAVVSASSLLSTQWRVHPTMK